KRPLSAGAQTTRLSHKCEKCTEFTGARRALFRAEISRQNEGERAWYAKDRDERCDLIRDRNAVAQHAVNRVDDRRREPNPDEQPHRFGIAVLFVEHAAEADENP